MTGRAACTTRTVPQNSVSNWSRASSMGVSSTDPARPQPAHATTASSRPYRSTTPATPSRTEVVIVDIHDQWGPGPGGGAPTAGPDHGPAASVEEFGTGLADAR